MPVDQFWIWKLLFFWCAGTSYNHPWCMYVCMCVCASRFCKTFAVEKKQKWRHSFTCNALVHLYRAHLHIVELASLFIYKTVFNAFLFINSKQIYFVLFLNWFYFSKTKLPPRYSILGLQRVQCNIYIFQPPIFPFFTPFLTFFWPWLG